MVASYNSSSKLVQNALATHYTPPQPGPAVVEGEELLALLTRLPSLSTAEHVDAMLVQIAKHHPGISLRRSDYIVIAFVDDCFGEILRLTDVDFKIEAFLRDLAPLVAVVALRDGLQAITKPQAILQLFDLLLQECIGWSEDLGILGLQYMQHIESGVQQLVSGKVDVETALRELRAVFRREKVRHEKLQNRLIEKEAVLLSEQRAKHFSAQLLNREMVNQKLPLFIIFMLQGAWYELLVGIYRHYGDKTEQWKHIEKLTRALIRSLQPGAGGHPPGNKRQSAITTLSARIRSFCQTLAFDTNAAVDSLADLDGEYEAILAGNASDSCDFDLMEINESMQSAALTIPEHLLREISRLDNHQWFLYDNKHESEEKVARIKLLLNHQGTESLLFTNHNRRKIMQMSYAELAGLISNDTVRVLSPEHAANDMIKSRLENVVKAYQQQKQKEEQEAEAERRRLMYREYLSERRDTLEQESELQAKRARRKHKRALVLRQKARKKLDAATQMVSQLRADAWMKLPVMEGTLTTCKLAAILPGSQTYVFVNRAGLKVAEYSPGQLAHLIVTENSEILDTGTEFESALASIVTGLREDKEKSYDELTSFQRTA